MSKDDFQRRPNPKGWTPPKAPYNPYDPSDARPPQGYPSEYKLPGQPPKGFLSLPRDPTQYKKVNETMNRLNYTPRPMSKLYPGQYKVLRKINTDQKVQHGTKLFGSIITGAAIVYCVFFYRWNEGRENVFSDFYRFQLRVKETFFGLTPIEIEDLYHTKEGRVRIKSVRDAQYIPIDIRKNVESDVALNKPSDKHWLEAERIKQDDEEKLLRELDEHRRFAQEMLEVTSEPKLKKKWWFF